MEGERRERRHPHIFPIHECSAMITTFCSHTLQVCSNVSDVTHHVTQYVNIIASLHRRINELERQKKEGWRRKGEGGGEGERMCSELKALLLEEKEIRYGRGGNGYT